ncbi:MAG: hypothetical protein PF590_01290 [Candidatus Delongbacteria bacterium]|jgi:hypothetical protein|nr:hypothetical protein [Candidatus Delongbacteria bacterium]
MKYQLISLLFALLLLNSCITQRACREMYLLPEITVDSIITITETIYRDTTIYVTLPGVTIRDTITVYVKENVANSKASIHETDLAWSKAQVINGILLHELQMKDSVLFVVIQNAIRESATLTEKSKHETKRVKINYLTNWQWMQVYFGRAMMLILAAFIGYIVLKITKKLP